MANISIGISMILFGIGLFIKSKFYFWKYSYFFDFSGGYNYFLGAICILGGIPFLWIEIRRKAKKR